MALAALCRHRFSDIY